MKRDLIEILFVSMITKMWIWTEVMGGECKFCIKSDTVNIGQVICDKDCNGTACTCFNSNQAACNNYQVLNLCSDF